MEVHRLNHHQWKMVFDAVRKAQKSLNYDSANYTEEYVEYHHILDQLYPLAYTESYDESTSIPGKPIVNDDEYNAIRQREDYDPSAFHKFGFH